ncbi:LysR family transcriptional regulator [Marinicella sp. W31]|uniref:LysR family transcriptional regulator n=1 Tax=Marinicella sp. W31 TaxID=3023713 RepID=UPI003758281E
MNKFSGLEAFVKTIDENGFSAAARKMGVATSSVTRLVDHLEHNLGTKLINRSTRRINITAAGEVFYCQAKNILRDINLAEETIRDLDTEERGTIKMSVPVALGRLCFMPIFNQFMSEYPAIKLDISFTDQHVDIVENDLDISIRIGSLPKTGNLISTKIMPQRRYVVGSKEYLKQYNSPLAPDELYSHHTLIYDYKSGQDIWRFCKSNNTEEIIEIVLDGRLRSNNSETLLMAVKAHLGLALLPDWLIKEDLKTGNLKSVLNEYTVNPHGMQPAIYLFYPENRKPMKKIRTFIDFIKHNI